MILDNQINFLNQCKSNIKKYNIYLNLTEPKISCEPSLALKIYYKWSLKYTFKAKVDDKEVIEYFNRVIEKQDYKIINNMEYEDFKSLIVAYYSLGEIYLSESKIELSKEYFSKVIDALQESLKNGNRYEHEILKNKIDISFFELLMWARKNIADIIQGEEGLEIYESIIGEGEFIYIQKNYNIYVLSKALDNPIKANEAARNILKILPVYENVNVDVVEYLTSCKEYSNGLEIAINEYKRTKDSHWINAIKYMLVYDEKFDINCVKKSIQFFETVINDLKLVQWSTLVFTLYNSVKQWDEALLEVLNYLRECFKKVDYESYDFISFPQCISVLNSIYEDIRYVKYENKHVREYEFDFVFYFMNVAIQNSRYDKAYEAATKIASIIEVSNKNKNLSEYVLNVKENASKNMQADSYNLNSYPWLYLYDKIDYIGKLCSMNDIININNKIKSYNNNLIVGINVLQNKLMEQEINGIIGEEIFCEDKDVVIISGQEFAIKDSVDRKKIKEILVEGTLVNELDVSLVTYNKAKYASLVDRNIIVLNGNNEVKEIDITYIKHILSINKDNAKIFMLVDKDSKDHNISTLNYNTTLILESLEEDIDIEVIDRSKFKNIKEVIKEILEKATSSLVEYRFRDFYKHISNGLEKIEDKIQLEDAANKKEINIIKGAYVEYKNMEEDSEGIYKLLTNKIKEDSEFLKDYINNKLNMIIPDILEKNLHLIDELNNMASIKEDSEKAINEIVVKWCDKNIYDLILEQFNVYLSKYGTLYEEQLEVLEEVEKNRNSVVQVYDGFSSEMNSIVSKSLEEFSQELLENYDKFLDDIDYEVDIMPNEKFFNSVSTNVKSMFMKPDEKLENQKVKMKTQIIDNKVAIASALCHKINGSIDQLQGKIQSEVEIIFKEVLRSIEIHKCAIEKIQEILRVEYEELNTNNKEIYNLIDFVNIELLKYETQINRGLVYYKDKCYNIK